MDEQIVSVAVVPSRIEAELAVGLLRSSGLKAGYTADDAGGTEPQLQLMGVHVVGVSERAGQWPICPRPALSLGRPLAPLCRQALARSGQSALAGPIRLGRLVALSIGWPIALAGRQASSLGWLICPGRPASFELGVVDLAPVGRWP